MLSLKWRCMKLTWRLKRLVALPGHPSTVKFVMVDFHGNSMRYSARLFRSRDAGTLSRPDRPCCVFLLHIRSHNRHGIVYTMEVYKHKRCVRTSVSDM